jgi:Flp pilus assembly protein TadG
MVGRGNRYVTGKARSTRGLLGCERGTALVEFALIAPILFLFLFGIIEFGRALNYYNDLTQLAGQGARAAIVSRNRTTRPSSVRSRSRIPPTTS